MSTDLNNKIDSILDRLVGKDVRPNAYAHERVDKNAITKNDAKQAIKDYKNNLEEGLK